MAKFKCEGCGAKRSLHKMTTVLRDKKLVVKEAECSCVEGQYMEQIITDEYKGVPGIIRTEPTHRKKK